MGRGSFDDVLEALSDICRDALPESEEELQDLANRRKLLVASIRAVLPVEKEERELRPLLEDPHLWQTLRRGVGEEFDILFDDLAGQFAGQDPAKGIRDWLQAHLELVSVPENDAVSLAEQTEDAAKACVREALRANIEAAVEGKEFSFLSLRGSIDRPFYTFASDLAARYYCSLPIEKRLERVFDATGEPLIEETLKALHDDVVAAYPDSLARDWPDATAFADILRQPFQPGRFLRPTIVRPEVAAHLVGRHYPLAIERFRRQPARLQRGTAGRKVAFILRRNNYKAFAGEA